MRYRLSSATLILLFLLVTHEVTAQRDYSIDISKADTSVMRGHLDLGGKGVDGSVIEVNNHYIEYDNVPFIPVIGEFHYSRYPNRYWDDELKKMKAGGINTVATYVFWNLHEAKEGIFRWDDDLNLRHFIELCASNGLKAIVRIGPFAHGEMRNGGLPDWLYGRPIEVRSNDKTYLYYVNRLYQQIGRQLEGLFFKDGGPILGIQLENEYQHSASSWVTNSYPNSPRETTASRRDLKITQAGVGINTLGNEFANEGSDHMKTLKKLAINAGIIAPIYTATGWGFATIVEKGSIPVMAGYAYPFWVPGNAPSPFYLFKDIRKNPDYSPVNYDVNLYPSMAAELGTGISVTYSQRPRVPGESFLPMMVRTIGSGSNGLGFYMYHGGTTPSVGNHFMSEPGVANKSYDYQAPIGEFGKVNIGFKGLKIINYFLNSYASLLAPLETVLPSTNAEIQETDTSTLRYAVRTDGESGFIFMQNFQDRIEMPDKKDISINVETHNSSFRFPSTGRFTLPTNGSAILPFNISFDGLKVKTAMVQPFMRFLNEDRPINVFISLPSMEGEIVFDGKVKVSGKGFTQTTKNGNTIIRVTTNEIAEIRGDKTTFIVIPLEKALDSYMVKVAGEEFLVVSKALVTTDNGKLVLTFSDGESCDLLVYPACKEIISERGMVEPIPQTLKSFSSWRITMPQEVPNIKLTRYDNSRFILQAQDFNFSTVNDLFVKFEYTGDFAVCMLDGEVATDDLFTSKPWEIGLKRFQDKLKENEMYFYFTPMTKGAPYIDFLDEEAIPDFGQARTFLEVQEPTISVEYAVALTMVLMR